MKKEIKKIFSDHDSQENFPVPSELRPGQMIDWSNDTIRLARLRALVQRNRTLPAGQQLTRYELAIEAGFDEDRARALDNRLIQNQKETKVETRGFDADSAKLVIQEIAHDSETKAETRLKAAELMLEVLGVKKKPSDSSQVALTLANILQDIFDKSEGRPKLISVKEVQNQAS